MDALTLIVFLVAYTAVIAVGFALLSYSLGHQGLKRKLIPSPIRFKRSKN